MEQNVQKYFIVRIAWVFGVNGKNFIKTMLRIGKERGAATVVDDQIGSPTYTYDLARLLVDMIQTEKYGTPLASALRVLSGVGVPSACNTSQSSVMVRSPKAWRSNTARRLRPMRR